MSEGVWIAIIGVLGLIITNFFGFKSLRATLKNNISLSESTQKNNLDLAIIQLETQQKQTHDLVNSRMSELLELTKRASEAEGKLQGIKEQKVITITEVKASEDKAEGRAEVKAAEAAAAPPTITNIKNVEIAHVENVENVETLITKTKEEKEKEEEQKKQ